MQGEPRLTHDIDCIISCSAAVAAPLQAEFPGPRFYCDETSVHAAVRDNGMFNLIDSTSGDKIDFWILTDTPFDTCRFSRRISAAVFSESAWISTPEDTILAKLNWAKISGGSEKQAADALRVYQTNRDALDRRYLAGWVLQLGIREQWDDLQSRLNP
jgi:hypothetical protein